MISDIVEELGRVTSGAKAGRKNKDFIAALEALRHPKPDHSGHGFSRAARASKDVGALAPGVLRNA